MTQPNTPVRVTVRDHFGKQFELDLGQCLSFGIAIKPSYLEQTPKRLGSDWIAQRLMSEKNLELRRIGNEGTWFVVDLEEMQGEVINLDQLRDLKPEEVSLDVGDDELCPLRMKIETQGYRALRNACWNPSGVCALVGPNGSGKTTLLRLLEFLRNAYLRNVPSAMDQLGGVYGLRSWNASPDSPVSVALTIGDLRWEIELTLHSSTLASKIAETITCNGEIVLLRPAWGQQFNYRGKEISIEATDDRMALRVVAESSVGDEFHRFVEMLKKFRVYRSYNIYSLQENGSRQGGDLYLHPSGQNLFTVLRNWRDRRELKHKFEFVVTHMRQAFPEVFEDLNFDVAGLTVTADFTDPNSKESYPSALAPDGVITGLLHLTAIAGAVPGSFVAVDDFGNDLHPFAIRQITAAIHELTEENSLTVCLASHSPVLLDEFKEHPSSVFVMEHGLENRPVPLTELFEEDWLSRFSLGQLYEYGEFGGQLDRTKAVE